MPTQQPVTHPSLFSTPTILILVFIFSNLLINSLFKEELFNLGTNIIIDWQQQYQSPFFDVFFYAITLLADPFLVITVTFTLIIVAKHKYRSFVTVIFILLNTYCTGVLKALYADPRPYWSNETVKSIGFYCPQEYGNPSGHSWFITIISFSVLIEYWGVGKGMRNLVLAAGLMILVPISRMYLGAHSLNQILQGLSLGLAMIFLYTFTSLKSQIESFLKNFNSEPKMKWKKVILSLHIIYFLCFLYNEKSINPYYKHTIPESWITNIKNKCNNKEVDTNHLNFMMLMVNSLLVNLATGIAMGFSELIRTDKGRLYLKGNWQINIQLYTPFKGNFYFYLLEIGYFLSGGVLAAGVIWLFEAKNNQIFVFICANLGAMLSGFLYTSKAHKKLFEWQVIRQVIE